METNVNFTVTRIEGNDGDTPTHFLVTRPIEDEVLLFNNRSNLSVTVEKTDDDYYLHLFPDCLEDTPLRACVASRRTMLNVGFDFSITDSKGPELRNSFFFLMSEKFFEEPSEERDELIGYLFEILPLLRDVEENNVKIDYVSFTF